jgi:hypothetical protein
MKKVIITERGCGLHPFFADLPDGTVHQTTLPCAAVDGALYRQVKCSNVTVTMIHTQHQLVAYFQIGHIRFPEWNKPQVGYGTEQTRIITYQERSMEQRSYSDEPPWQGAWDYKQESIAWTWSRIIGNAASGTTAMRLPCIDPTVKVSWFPHSLLRPYRVVLVLQCRGVAGHPGGSGSCSDVPDWGTLCDQLGPGS